MTALLSQAEQDCKQKIAASSRGGFETGRHLLRQQCRQQLHQHRILVAVRLRLLLQLRAARLLLRRQLLADVQAGQVAGQVRCGARVPHAVATPQPRQVALLHRTQRW